MKIVKISQLLVLAAVASNPLAVDAKNMVVFEAYSKNNWDLYVASVDGAAKANITNTPDQNELYPQASPDGRKVCFVVDTGSGRQTVRSLWVMNMDGTGRKKIADHARQPCWSPDSKTILYLPQEYKKFNVVDYFTKGIMFYDVAGGKTRPHPNTEKIHHLYNPSISANGKWIAATVHAGMGYRHAILLIEANGPRIIDLKIRGCRPCLSADGKRISWGESDHTLVVAELDVSAETPKVGKRHLQIHDKKRKIYHSDLSADGKFLALSRGPNGKGDLSKPSTHEAACEIVGVYAKDWNVFVVPIPEAQTTLDLNSAKEGDFLKITTDGLSNKEPDFFTPGK